MISAQQLHALDPQTRQVMLSLLEQIRAKDALIAQREQEAAFKQALIDKLTHEMAVLKRLKFAATSERFASTLAPEQKSLLEETLETDLAELDRELDHERGQGKDKAEKKAPKRAPLPPNLPRRDVAHEPADTRCGCGQPMQRIGQDVAEKLDYQPGVFTVERHVRGKWACRCCQKLVQAPVPPHVIDKGIPTAGLLAHLLVAKFMDHLPLYRQEHIFERAGHLIARSTLAQWVGECGAHTATTGAGAGRRIAPPCGAARRRDAGGDAQAQAPERRQDTQGLHLVVLHDQRQPDEGRGVRVLRDAQRRERARVSQAGHAPRVAGHVGNRWLQRLHRHHDQGRDLGAMHGARQAKVQRPVGQPR